ncbi:hypothetical protein AGMMS49965_17770 [Bacteroidia bacterium]|nr:hypothetical protein AGMMS49965_17770 [Bacteroidia bacterium]
MLSIFISCGNKNQNVVADNCVSLDSQGLNPTEIRQHMEFQTRIETEDNKNIYNMTEKDIEIASELILKGLMQNGFKPLSDEQFNDKLQSIFGLSLTCSTKDIIRHKNFFVYLIDDGWSKDILRETEYDYTYDHLYFITNHHIVTTVPHLGDFVEKVDDEYIRICLSEKTIHRNKYIFNNDSLSLLWLQFHDMEFLEQLVQIFGYDKEPQINKAVLRKIGKEYCQISYNADGFEVYDFDTNKLEYLFAGRDGEGKLHIREGLFKTVAESYVSDETRFIETSKTSDKNLFYTLMEDYYYKFVRNQDDKFSLEATFSLEERSHVLAAILNTMHACSQVHRLHDYGPEVIIQSVPEMIECIAAHDYFGYPNLQSYLTDMQGSIESYPDPE